MKPCSAPFTTDGAYRPILDKMPHVKLEEVNTKLVLVYRYDLSLCLIAMSERLKWPFDLLGLFSSGFCTGPCGKEGNEVLPVRKGDFDHTLLRMAILDGLCRTGANSSGNQRGFTEKGSPPSRQ